MGGGGGSSSNSFSLPLGGFGDKKNDGSARSIHLQSPVVTKWQRSSQAVKISYSVAFCSFWIVVFGWRLLTYQSAAINLECTSFDCTFSMYGVGREKKIRLTLPRHQVIGTRPVKVDKSGVIVNDNVDMNSEWKYQPERGGKAKNKKKSQSQNYKGPDKDGNYLTYFITVRDRDAKTEAARKAEQNSNGDDGEDSSEIKDAESVDLSPIMKFAVPAPQKEGETDGATKEIRVVMRQHGIQQSRRRVRNMTQKIDSFAKKRRHKLSVKESASPDWRAILMLVLGGCSFLLSLLLGLFWEDEEATTRQVSGPASRRRMQQQQQRQTMSNAKRGTSYNSGGSAPKGTGGPSGNPYQRTTPSRYEVNTQPSLRRSSGGPAPIRRRNNG